jgi:hypothetical protein
MAIRRPTRAQCSPENLGECAHPGRASRWAPLETQPVKTYDSYVFEGRPQSAETLVGGVGFGYPILQGC